MTTPSLEQVAEAVVRRAQRQGSVVARDVRAELRLAALPEDQWKAVVAIARPVLRFRQGRYYHKDAFSPRLLKEQAQRRAVQRVLRGLLKQHRARSKEAERRGQVRLDFIQPVTVRTEDGKTYALLCRDLSATGIRLLGTRRLLGQRVRVTLPPVEGQPPCVVLMRVLWTCAVGDDLFENGGTFLELVEEPDPLAS
jgi:hypothetical protein